MNIAFKKTTLCLASTLSLVAAAWSPAASACGSEDFIGSICIFAGNFDIRNYASTSGQLIPISTNAALFSILGTTYGGDGRTTFARITSYNVCYTKLLRSPGPDRAACDRSQGNSQTRIV